ncbi:Asd/ArgC dimerization domain-containing protein [Marinobacterium sp. MBR-109]|jgi:aspartate-semialdehyde dehydrogenase|uniref:Asd/ArgC dimerization domain-containing protein n=1 Tax=Marinobacterium sp. MBR-109 TaxID=3156462 RepID=UPI0033990C0C
MPLKIALLGPATLAGEKLLELLDESTLEIDTLTLFEPEEQAGRSLMFRGHAHRTRSLDAFDASSLQLTFVCEAEIGSELKQSLLEAPGWIVDMYPQRYEADQVFLTIPELNGDELASLDPGRVIGIPNSATIAAALALAPLHQACQILKANLMLLSPVSSAGRPGVEALASETARLLNGRDPESGHFGQQIAFNLIPQVGTLLESGYTDIEAAVRIQLPQVLGDEGLELEVSAVQVPVFYGDMVVIQAETRQPLNLDEVQQLMDRAPGVRYDQHARQVPGLIKDAIGQQQVVVARLRPDAEGEAGFALHAMSDDLGRGSALTALGAAMRLVAQG